MVYYPFEHRAKGNAVVTAEGSRKSNDGYLMRRLCYLDALWMLDICIKLGQ